jgi:pyruvate/2-oxoglutarate dehydrogenase complex dihydrolipoamide acyltransferase (E2) component
MPTEVRLPQYSMGMAEGTVAAWFKRVGDTVAEGEELAEIEAEKVVMILEAPVAGVISELAVAEGETVAVRSLLAVIDTAGT